MTPCSMCQSPSAVHHTNPAIFSLQPEDKSSVWDQILKHEDFKQRSFSDIDTNKDGYITREELQKAVGPNFHPQCGELSQ